MSSNKIYNNLITLFDNHYQQYLNNFNKNNIIDSFIEKYLILIEHNDNKYKLIKNTHDSNLYENIDYIKIVFNDEILAFLLFDKKIEHPSFNLFISYLSLLLYNTNYNKIIESINHTIFTEIIDMIHDGIIVCDNNYNIHIINNIAKNIINTLNIHNTDNFNYFNIKLFNIFSQLEDILKFNEIYKNKKIYYNIQKNNNDVKILLTINTIIYNDLYYYVIILTFVNKDKTNINNDGFLSHELRNPLQTINFANHLIQQKNINDEFKKYLTIIDKSVYDMIKIINDILDIDRLDSNKLDLKFELVNILELIDNIKFDFSRHLNNNLIKFNIILDDSLIEIKHCFYTDITRIKQILLNILDNSVKYSKSNTTNNITLKICYDNISKYINFMISDTGIGIKHDNINNIFDRTFINNNNKYNSNGLGLYICNKLANLLGVTIKINSIYQYGSEFILLHPIKIINNNKKKIIENMNINAKILFVDNNQNILLLFKDIIENIKCKYQIKDKIFLDCHELNELIIDIIKVNNYDIIFLDINGENINGITIARLIRRNGFTNKIIGMIYNLDNSLDKSLFDDFLIKPFCENEILEQICLF